MKKLFFVAMASFAMFFSSCSSDHADAIEQFGEKTVSVSLNGDFTFEPFTRSSSSAVNTAKDVWVLDYMDGKLVQTIHQKNGDVNFGNPKMPLKYGKHDMYFIVSSGENPNLMAGINIINWDTVGDTFWASSTAEINASSPSNLSVFMNRIVTMLKLKSADNIPENAKYIKIVPKVWQYGFDYLTGKPNSISTDREVVYEIDNNGSRAEISLYGFSSNDEESTEIKVYSLSESNGVIKYSNIPSVPFNSNRITTMTGWLFSSSSNGITGDYNYSLMLNSNWNSGYEMIW
jgi:hypothetical protein